MTQIPKAGRIVLYTLNISDAAAINMNREAARGRNALKTVGVPAGEMIHAGNTVEAGDVFPMIITRVWGPTAESAVNGQVMLDGNDTHWRTSACVGAGWGTFAWPVRD